MSAEVKLGLDGVVAGQTAICQVSYEENGLCYRGYGIDELCQHSSFEEVAYLLIEGQLPTQAQLHHYIDDLVERRVINDGVEKLLEMIPARTHPMDVLRTSCSFIGNVQSSTQLNDIKACAHQLIARLPYALIYWFRFHREGIRISPESKQKSIAGYFLELLHGEADSIYQEALDTSLILYAEHEFNASTFAARTTTATCSDYFSAMTSAIGTLRGYLHGGANEKAMELIEQFASPQEAVEGVQALLDRGEKIMGFGHRVYKTHDPRSPIIKKIAKMLTDHHQQPMLYDVAESIEHFMWQEKKLFPNVDFYSAPVYHACRIPTELFTPLFVLSRLSGWSAHVIEQQENNRLIRPAASYVGPEPRPYPSMSQR